MSNVEFWIRDFPAPVREAVMEAIGTARLGKVRRALRELAELEPGWRGQPFPIDLLSTYNLEPALPAFQLALNCLPSQARVELAPLNDIEGYLNRTAEGANARVILWRVEEVLPEVLFPFTNGFPEQLNARVEEARRRFRRVVSLHQRQAAGTPLFLSTFALPRNFANRVFAAQHSVGAFSAVARLNEEIYSLGAEQSGVYVLDVCAWDAGEGHAAEDPLLDFMARQPINAAGQMSLALFLAHSLRPLLYPRAKVLALDLDNTLWGGVVGEDGISGLKLGHEFPGNVHLRIQRELLELRNRGVLLVLLSKNNEADARAAFESLPEMLLKWDDFSVRKVDWNHKHENLRAAARDLGLGLDSFVFLDDSDYEREQMRQMIPEVRILNHSGDALQILRALWETDAFDSLTITAEDRARHQDYAVRGARDTSAHEDDLEAFLRSLQMEATIEEVSPANLERVTAMLSKTNQFNLTTRRHSQLEVQKLLAKSGSIALALRLRDKFGEQGIVAVLLATTAADEPRLVIDSFLVSCRALGRGVEDALWSELLQRARRQNASSIEASYIPTSKNVIVAELYDRLGLQRVASDASSTRYVLESIPPVEWPAWIVANNGRHEH